MKKKWIILDRDGVINYDSDDYIKSPEEWIPIPGSLEAIARLNWAGYYILLVTNQSGIARKLFDETTLDLIHKKMQDALLAVGGHIEGVFYCPHQPKDHCSCRKPKNGLFKSIINDYKIDLQGVPAIGDKLSDIQAARAAGCRPILVRTGRGEKTLAENAGQPDLKNVPVYADLAAAVAAILREKTE
jgi:D-glycero-D-manno-heptose 1,7-bisphosphate phosphatase